MAIDDSAGDGYQSLSNIHRHLGLLVRPGTLYSPCIVEASPQALFVNDRLRYQTWLSLSIIFLNTDMDDTMSLSVRSQGNCKIPYHLPYFAQVPQDKKGRCREGYATLAFSAFQWTQVGDASSSWLKISPTPPPLELVPCSVQKN